MVLVPGQAIGKFQILEPLGQGGMASVYKAYQPSLDREVALKVLRPGFADDPEFLDRFQREARSIARLRHPHIVQIFDFDSLDGRHVLAMEYLEGGTLKERLAAFAERHERMPRTEVARLISEIASALTHAHELGIVHRDVKPANVMIARRGAAVVTDFGIARILGGTSHTQTGVGIGTPEYMAPEQGQGGEVDARADTYSLAVMAYEMLTGRVPFRADTPLAVVLAHIKDPLPLPSTIDATLKGETERVLMKALAKDPAQRYESANDFAAALSSALRAPGADEPTTMIAATRATSSRLPLLPLVAGVVVVALVIGGVLVSRGLTSAPATAGPAPALGASPSVPPGGGNPLAPVTGGSVSAAYAAMHATPAIYSAKFDGSPGEVTSQPPAIATFRNENGALELTTPNAGQQVDVVLSSSQTASTQYAVDMVVAFGQTSVMRFAACFRMAAEGAYCLTFLTGSDTLELRVQGSSTEVMGASVSVAGVRARPFTLQLVVDRGTFTVFIDDRMVMQRTDSRFAATSQPLHLQAARLGSNPNDTGNVRISALHVYKLAGQ